MFTAERRNTELEQDKACSVVHNLFYYWSINFKEKSPKRFGPQIARV